MRRRWKIFWIICGSAALLGIICCMAAVGLGVTSNAIRARAPYGIGIVDDGDDTVDDDGEIVTDDLTQSFSGIRKVDAEISAGEVQILPSDTQEVRIETEMLDSRLNFQYKVEGDTLEITTTENFLKLFRNHNRGTIYLYLPMNTAQEEVNIKLGAGSLFVENVSAAELGVDVGAGKAELADFRAREVDLQCGTGQITARGSVGESVNMNCGIGEIDATVFGREEDYSYDVNCGIGQVIVGTRSFSGVSREQSQMENGNGNKELNIECGIGKVAVDFEDAV